MSKQDENMNKLSIKRCQNHIIILKLKEIWNNNPYLRFGQLLGNVVSGEGDIDLYYIQDEALVKKLSDFYNTICKEIKQEK